MSKNFSNLLGGALASKQAAETNIRDQIIIREEFKALIPPLTAEELEQLEENILKEGVRDPLVIWPVADSFILVDGHNRFSICQKHGLDFPFKKVEFKDDEEVRGWMIKNQLGRRNLTPAQQSYFRGLRYLKEKSQGKRTDLTLDQNDLKLNESTAVELAKEYGVSEATIKRDAEFAAGVEAIGKDNPELKKEILKGNSKISKQEVRNKAKKSKSSKIKNKIKLPSADEVAAIAFEFIRTETRSIDELFKTLGEEDSNMKPMAFFMKWKETQKTKI